MAISNITSTTTKYTVIKGDTFSEIAKQCKNVGVPGFTSTMTYSQYVKQLQKLNPDIENINYIKVGQVIILQGTPKKKTTNNTQRVKITNIGLQSDTDRTVFVTWSWSKSKTDHYEVEWRYNTENNIKNGFPGTTETTTEKLSIYSGAPENSTCVSVRVKPVSTTYTSNNKEVHYWTADWSSWWTAESTYNWKDNPPLEPPAPEDIKISSKHKMTIKLTGLEVNAAGIQFEIEKDSVEGYKKGNAEIKTSNGSASFSTTVAPGAYYRVRCRSYRDGMYSEWSDWSETISSEPATTSGIYSIYALSELKNQENQFVIRLHWYTVNGADNYVVQYTTNETYFDSNQSEVQEIDMGGSKSNPVSIDHAEITGLTGGLTYFFRVCAVTNTKKGGWSEVVGIVLGEKPTAPTTWSSTTSAISGEPLTLYWVHNSQDGSSETYADLELTTIGVVNGEYVDKTEILNLENTSAPEDRDKTRFYVIDTSQYDEGVKIKWRVRTAGILIDADTGDYVYGDWSVLREVVVYAQPSVELTVTNYDGATFTDLTSFPINISAYAGPNTQKPIGYHLSIIANDDYKTVDNVGNEKMVVTGTAVYSKYFDISDNPLEVTLSAGDLSLSNNESYTIICSVCMDSGLTAEESKSFTVAWAEVNEMWPNAEIIYDKETFTTAIKPYCRGLNTYYDDDGFEQVEDGDLIDGITLTVYRREFDGTFTELDTVNNTDEEYITDPHPSLDYARYRIVAVSDATGAVSYYDMPGFPIEEPSVILQWDEEWTNFNLSNEDTLKERHWSGSLLKLMYNIDESDQHEKDVELINYIGREHPVSYYGTQIGHTATWNMEIDKDDEETIYALRRLARWMGNVYVRAPSGSSYWADVKVSFSKTHKELTIPVTLEITRVEGGI